MKKKILYNERGLTLGTEDKKDQWKNIIIHSDSEIKGFFGDYRFLSNFWPVKVFLDNDLYPSIENAYQAAKYPRNKRSFLQTCTPKEAVEYSRNNPLNTESSNQWDARKIIVMENLLIQKFDKELNPDVYSKIKNTGDRYLEESNYWEDVFWGVHKTKASDKGVGENNLGKLLMKIRDHLKGLT